MTMLKIGNSSRVLPRILECLTFLLYTTIIKQEISAQVLCHILCKAVFPPETFLVKSIHKLLRNQALELKPWK